MSRRFSTNYVLTEIEPAKRYVLHQEGQDWRKEFSSVSSAYFFARSISDANGGRLMVVNQAGEQCTLFLF